MDETAVTWCIGPTHLFVPKTQSRARNVGVNNVKLRITTAIAFNGVGEGAPLYLIIYHSAKVTSQVRLNQLSLRVIQQLHRANDGFGEAHGWALKVWTKTIDIDGEGVKEHK